MVLVCGGALILGARGRKVSEAFDPSIYRAQLSAIDRDLAAGLVAPSEAEPARAEIKRRMLSSARSAGMDGERRGSAGRTAKSLGFIAFGALPALAIAIYSFLGRPDLPAAPSAARGEERLAAGLMAPEERAQLAELVQQLEDVMAARPDDPAGWSLLGSSLLRLGRSADAARALERAIAVGGETAERLGALGEALVLAADGRVSEEARGVFVRLQRLDPSSPQARFFLGLADAQAGNVAGAQAIWRKLLEESPADAPWRASVEAELEKANRLLSTPPDGQSVPDPAGAEAVLSLGPREQQEAIEGMVAGLSERLREAPEDLPGWLRLIRSYAVLGRPQEASAAAGEALAHYDGRVQERAAIEALMRDLGIEEPDPADRSP